MAKIVAEVGMAALFFAMILLLCWLYWISHKSKVENKSFSRKVMPNKYNYTNEKNALENIFSKQFPSIPLAFYLEPPVIDRIVGCTELGMGGPTIEFYLLKERVVFGGVYNGVQDFDNGNLRCAHEPTRDGSVYHIYDKRKHCIYHFPLEDINELLDGIKDEGVKTDKLRALCDSKGQPCELHEFHGIFFETANNDDKPLVKKLTSGRILTAYRVLADDLFMSKSPMALIWHTLYKLEIESISHPPIYISRLYNNYSESPSGDDFYVEGVTMDKDFHSRDILYLFHLQKLFVIQEKYIEWTVDDSIYRAKMEHPECTGNGVFRFLLSFSNAEELNEKVSNSRAISGGRIRVWWDYQYMDFRVQPVSTHVVIDLSVL